MHHVFHLKNISGAVLGCQAPDKEFTQDGARYYWNSQKTWVDTFASSEAACSQVGARLAVISDPESQDAVFRRKGYYKEGRFTRTGIFVSLRVARRCATQLELILTLSRATSRNSEQHKNRCSCKYTINFEATTLNPWRDSISRPLSINHDAGCHL
jgi:hypothetical protein